MWTEDVDAPGRTLCTELTRDGVKQVFLGVFGAKGATAGIVNLGAAQFVVNTDAAIDLMADDFALVTAEIMEIDGQVRSVAPSREIPVVQKPVFRNELAQNYPNPFNPTTAISFSLERNSDVDLTIYNVQGARVRTLASGRRATGVHQVTWDGRDERGTAIASGVYFYKLVAGPFTDTKKMTILK